MESQDWVIYQFTCITKNPDPILFPLCYPQHNCYPCWSQDGHLIPGIISPYPSTRAKKCNCLYLVHFCWTFSEMSLNCFPAHMTYIIIYNSGCMSTPKPITNKGNEIYICIYTNTYIHTHTHFNMRRWGWGRIIFLRK